MKFTRIMRLDKQEIIEIINKGEIKFEELQSWSGENKNNREWFEVDGMYGDYEVVLNFEDDLNNFRKCNNEEIENEAFDAVELDEYRNLEEMTLKIDDIDFIREIVEEDGIDSYLKDICDCGYVQFTLKR